jgi:drug/metabolite transporter (DMT)-like permease
MSTSGPQAAASAAARPIDLAAVAVILVLSLSWGFNQVAVKLAIHDIPPLIQSTIRSCGAALIVVAWMRARGIPIDVRDGTLAPGIAAGVLFALEFVLIYRGLVWTTATRAVLFIYMAPFFVALGARWFLPAERLGVSQWLGLALSFAGVAVAIGVPRPAADRWEMIGDLMMIGAAAAWGATTLVIKASALARTAPERTLLYQLVVSAPLLGLAALAVGERLPAAPSGLALASLAYQTVWVVGITFGIWFALIVRYSASRISAFTFLTPLFGVAAGHVVLGEPVSPAFAAAVALVAAGLVLVNRRA